MVLILEFKGSAANKGAGWSTFKQGRAGSLITRLLLTSPYPLTATMLRVLAAAAVIASASAFSISPVT